MVCDMFRVQGRGCVCYVSCSVEWVFDMFRVQMRGCVICFGFRGEGV